MKTFQIYRYGRKEQLHLAEVPIPKIKDDEVLVDIYAAGLNPLDIKLKSGAFKLILPYKMPLTLGHDLAGIVSKTGKNVTRFKVGDEVYARVPDFHIGTLAEAIAVREDSVALKPRNLSFTEAASVPLVALTAWQALFETGHLQRGQKVFIQAGSGGVGTLAIQLAKHAGAFVATTASKKNATFLKDLGADIVIDYKTQDFGNILSDYDVVLNSQDSETLKKSIRITKRGGRVVSLSGPPTPDFAMAIGASWFIKFIMKLLSSGIYKRAKKQGVHYNFLFMHPCGKQLETIARLIESGFLNPVIDKVFDFRQTPEAFDYLNQGHTKGKVVVKIK